MPGLSFVSMDVEEASDEARLPSLPLEKPASQNLITDFFRQPKKSASFISKESIKPEGNLKKHEPEDAEPCKSKRMVRGGMAGSTLSVSSFIPKTDPTKTANPKLSSTAEGDVMSLDNSLDDFKEEEMHKKETKFKSKRLKKGKNAVAFPTESKRRETATEQLEISYEDFLRSVGPEEDSVILLGEGDSKSKNLPACLSKPKEGSGDCVQNTTFDSTNCKPGQDTETDYKDHHSTTPLSSGDVKKSHSVMSTADRTKIASSKKMLNFSEERGDVNGEGKTMDEAGDGTQSPISPPDKAKVKSMDETGDGTQSLVSPPDKAKVKSKGIAMFFTKASKKSQNKKEDDSVTITVKAEVHAEPGGLSRERCNSESRSLSGHEGSPGGSSQRRRSNVVVDDCDLTITHLDTTIINLPDKKNKLENKNNSDVIKPGVKAAVEEQDDSCIITREEVPKDLPEQTLTDEEVKKQEEHDLKQREERRKQAAAQMASLDKVKVKVSNSSRQGTLGFGIQGLTTIKPSKVPVPEVSNPAPLTASQPELDTSSGEELEEQSTSTSKVTMKSSRRTNKSKKSTKTGEKKDELCSKGRRTTTVVKPPLTSTPKVKGKKTVQCDVTTKTPKAKVCRRKGRARVESESGGDVPLTESDEQTQESTSEENVEVFKSVLLGVSPGSAKSKKTPIKMRFTRLRSQKLLASEGKVTEKQQKVTRAQQLLQKAKSVSKKKQGLKGSKPSAAAKGATVKGRKKKITAETESVNVRRSSRASAMTAKVAISVSFEEKVRPKRKQFVESDDSDVEVVKFETQSKRKKSKESKPGKKPSPQKKVAPKLASIFRKKNSGDTEVSGSTDDVIPVDPELLKVRRQFLMSGVPQELRKQKAAADMASTNYEYPPIPEVSHVQQRPPGTESCTDSQMTPDPWNLPNVELTFRETSTSDEIIVKDADFRKLKRLCDGGPRPRLDGSKQRAEIPAEIKPYLLAEISLSNPAYPVRRVFRQLTKKDEEKDNSQKEDSAGEKSLKEATTIGVEDVCKGKKRKLPEAERDAESEVSSRQSKRRRAHQDTGDGPVPPVRRSSRVNAKRQSLDDCQIIIGERTEVSSKSDIGEDGKVGTSSGSGQDQTPPECQWTEKYQPRSGAEVLGNLSCVKKLKTWLIEWIQRTDLEIRRLRKQIMKQAKRTGKSREETKKEISKQLGSEWMMDDDSDFDLGSSEEDSDYEETDSLICNTMVVSGPHGVGKTAMVYALAQELGYKVFEVNASNRRNGKLILAQLQEATQSHQVSKKNLDSMFTSSMAAQENSKKASTQKPNQNPEKKLPTAFANLFKKSSGGPQSCTSEKSQSGPGKSSSHPLKRGGAKKTTETKNGVTFSPAGKACPQPGTPAKDDSSNSRKGLNLSSTSLILFEEVDIVFEEDKGFWTAIQTFMSLTKRPIILTTSDPKVASTVQGRHEHLCMKIPPMVNIASHMQLVCLAENVRTDFSDLLTLVDLYKGNIRQCFLSLQFWLLSGGGICQEEVPVKYHPNFFTSKKEIVVGGLTPLKPASPRSGPRDSPKPLQAHLLLEAARDSSDEFESDSPKPRRRHAGRPIIEDDSSMDSLGGTPTKLGVSRLHSTQEEDSQEGHEIANTRPSTGEDELLVADLAVTPARHKMCFESLTSAGDGHQNLFTLLKQCKTSVDMSGIEDFLNENLDVVYSNVLRLLCLPHSEAVRRPACFFTNSLPSRPVQRKRIRCATELFGGNDSDDECFVSLSKRPESECPDNCLSQSASNEPVSGSESNTHPKLSSKISDEDRILLKSVKSLADMYDQFSALDAYMLRPRGDSEGTCGRNAHVWSAGRLVPGLSSQGGRCDDQHNGNDWVASAAATHVQLGSVARANLELQSSLDAINQLSSREGLEEKICLPLERGHGLGLQFTQETSIYRRLGASHRNCLEYVSSVLPSHVQCQKKAIAMDYLPSLRTMCRSEQLRRVTNTKRRFLHYMDYISLPVMRKQFVVNTLCSSFT